jgi:aminoglycoside 2''-phosphotransferase
MTPIPQGSVDLDALTARIAAAFPDLAFARAALNDEGEDHAVVILDDAWVFRFPRTEERRVLFETEMELLKHIGAETPVPVPQYAHVAPGAAFGGYAMIKGRPLTAAAFQAISQPGQARVLDQMADLLCLIHSTSPKIITREGGKVARGWNGADFARRYRARRRERIAQVVTPRLIKAIDVFYEALAGRPAAAAETVVHGDLTADHMLLAPGGERLAGVIDFADAELDDPAHDFTFFWAYGDWAPAHVAKRYGATDSGLLSRSRWSFARYRVDQLRWAADGHINNLDAPTEGEMMELFAALGV